MNDIEALKGRIRDFARERNWEKYHSPKNLAMALSVEAAELLEIFEWLTEDESHDLSEGQLSALKEEIGDVLIYLTSLADKFGLDPVECAEAKIELNRTKYPPQLVKGSAEKYNELTASDAVWSRIQSHAGEKFLQKRGGQEDNNEKAE